MSSAARALVIVIAAAACGAPAASPVATAASVPATTPAATVAQTAPPAAAAPSAAAPTPKATFPAGLYVVKPALDHPGGTVELLESTATLAKPLAFTGVGYEISADLFIYTEFDGLVLVRPDGTSQKLKVNGLYALGRPSLSPDSKLVFLQATDTAFAQAPNVQRPQDDTVWIVDLATGSFRRIGDKASASDPSTQSEQPVFFPSGDRVAYWAVESNCLVIKVRDAATARDVLTIRKGGVTGCYQPQRGILDGPRFHVSVSHDSSRILIPGQMQLFDAKTGALVADVHQKALDGLAAAGYKPDARFPGAGSGGTFPLSGTFSLDDKTIVFDGAVEKDGQFGVLLCKINVDGSGFAVMRGPTQVTPMFSNNHNFSQLLPHWLAGR